MERRSGVGRFLERRSESRSDLGAAHRNSSRSGERSDAPKIPEAIFGANAKKIVAKFLKFHKFLIDFCFNGINCSEKLRFLFI